MAFTETLRIIIDANTKGFVAATKQASDSTKRMDGTVAATKQRIGGFAKAAAIGLAGVGIAAVAMGDDFIRAAEESNKVSAQTDAVLKSMGLSAQVSADQIAGLSQKLSLKSGVDDEVIQSGENVLLTFRSVAATAGETGGAFDRATQAALDMSVFFKQDMQSSIMQVGKALNDPIRGLTALRRVGVQFTKAQEDQIKAMVAAGDQAGAMNLILQELEREVGGSAEAQATASDKLSVAWENLQEVIGNKLLPVVEKFTTWLTKTGIPALEAMIDWIGRNKMVLLGLAVMIATVVIPTFVAWAVATIAATWPLLAIGAAVGVLAVLVVKHFDTIKKAVEAAFNWIKDHWPLIVAILTGPVGVAVLLIIKYWNKIKDVFAAGWRTIRDFFVALPGRIQAYLATAGRWLLEGGRNILRGLAAGISEIWGRLADWFRDRRAAVSDYFAKAIDWLKLGGRNIIRGLWSGIRSIWQDVVDWFKDVPGKILRALGISSPPKWAIDAGKWIMKGIVKGVGMLAGNALDFMRGLAGKFTGPLRDAWDAVWGAIPILGGGGNQTNRAMGQQMASALYGWIGDQWAALNALVMSESGWSNTAQNPTSTAYGIGQFLDSTWAGTGYSKTSDPAIQIRAMLKYIAQRYGDPASAWAFKQSHNWYATGGIHERTGLVGVHAGEMTLNRSQQAALFQVANLRPRHGSGAPVYIHIHNPVVAGEAEFAYMVTRAIRKAGDMGVPITIRGRSL